MFETLDEDGLARAAPRSSKTDSGSDRRPQRRSRMRSRLTPKNIILYVLGIATIALGVVLSLKTGFGGIPAIRSRRFWPRYPACPSAPRRFSSAPSTSCFFRSTSRPGSFCSCSARWRSSRRSPIFGIPSSPASRRRARQAIRRSSPPPARSRSDRRS
ncbi:MAG: hypothetical protein MZU97_11295 [Bacillus subtilis]|nr:hypothetical protein [Bacillus subtilis]